MWAVLILVLICLVWFGWVLWHINHCYKMAEGFQFMPLSLVGLGVFQHGAWVGWGQLRQVLARVRTSGWRCHPDVMMVRDETHRKRVEVCVRIWEESRVLDAKREGSTFGARRRQANVHPMGAARVGGQMNKTA